MNNILRKKKERKKKEVKIILMLHMKKKSQTREREVIQLTKARTGPSTTPLPNPLFSII
jgi:hypothetical protein